MVLCTFQQLQINIHECKWERTSGEHRSQPPCACVCVTGEMEAGVLITGTRTVNSLRSVRNDPSENSITQLARCSTRSLQGVDVVLALTINVELGGSKMLLWSRRLFQKFSITALIRQLVWDLSACLQVHRRDQRNRRGAAHFHSPQIQKRWALSYFPAIFLQRNQNPLRAVHHIFTEVDGDALPGGLRWIRQELNINCEWFIAWSLDRPAAQLQLLVGPGLLPGLAAIAWLGQQKPHIRVSVGASRLCHPCWGGNEARKTPPHVRGIQGLMLGPNQL